MTACTQHCLHTICWQVLHVSTYYCCTPGRLWPRCGRVDAAAAGAPVARPERVTIAHSGETVMHGMAKNKCLQGLADSKSLSMVDLGPRRLTHSHTLPPRAQHDRRSSALQKLLPIYLLPCQAENCHYPCWDFPAFNRPAHTNCTTRLAYDNFVAQTLTTDNTCNK